VERVAQHLGLGDPSKIRLTSHNCYSQQPKPQPIKYRGVEHLSDMLVHYNQVIYHMGFTLFWTCDPHFFQCDSVADKSMYSLFFLDFWYSLLWSIGYTPARIARPKNFESCFSSFYKGWSKWR